ncbi:MAG: hypothetical protein A3F10_02065 [Coxiella sp. RIFCSPHIGHO2_12_FULL_42_15]|nr:MAG: hypothetical protein A3F10_02065 [Coxiella sp. RIFCSPHIGHO2_12_FULL_42_15]
MIKGLSIVIPVYNEEANILPLLTEIRETLQTVFPYEIIFVDDASEDTTRAVIERASTEVREVRLLRHTHNRGQSAALVSGVRQARFDWIATLDGDRQNDPRDLHLLLAAIHCQTAQSVLCMGQRAKRQDNWLRRVSTKIANGVRQWFLQDQCADSGCGIKIFPRDVFLALPLFRNCHRFLPALFVRAKIPVIYVKVSHRPRVAGHSKYGVRNRLWVGIVDLWGVAWLMRRFIEFEREADV